MQVLSWVWLLAHLVLQAISLGSEVSNSNFPLSILEVHVAFSYYALLTTLANFWATSLVP